MTLWLMSIKPPILGIFSVDKYTCIRRIFPKVVNYQVSIWSAFIATRATISVVAFS